MSVIPIMSPDEILKKAKALALNDAFSARLRLRVSYRRLAKLAQDVTVTGCFVVTKPGKKIETPNGWVTVHHRIEIERWNKLPQTASK